jgi:hypothetical protein
MKNTSQKETAILATISCGRNISITLIIIATGC